MHQTECTTSLVWMHHLPSLNALPLWTKCTRLNAPSKYVKNANSILFFYVLYIIILIRTELSRMFVNKKKLYFKHVHIETYSHSCYFSPLHDQPGCCTASGSQRWWCRDFHRQSGAELKLVLTKLKEYVAQIHNKYIIVQYAEWWTKQLLFPNKGSSVTDHITCHSVLTLSKVVKEIRD